MSTCTFVCDWFHSYRQACLESPCLSQSDACVAGGAPPGSDCGQWCCVYEPIRALVFLLPAIGAAFLVCVLGRLGYRCYVTSKRAEKACQYPPPVHGDVSRMVEDQRTSPRSAAVTHYVDDEDADLEYDTAATATGVTVAQLADAERSRQPFAEGAARQLDWWQRSPSNRGGAAPSPTPAAHRTGSHPSVDEQDKRRLGGPTIPPQARPKSLPPSVIPPSPKALPQDSMVEVSSHELAPRAPSSPASPPPDNPNAPLTAAPTTIVAPPLGPMGRKMAPTTRPVAHPIVTHLDPTTTRIASSASQQPPDVSPVLPSRRSRPSTSPGSDGSWTATKRKSWYE